MREPPVNWKRRYASAEGTGIDSSCPWFARQTVGKLGQEAANQGELIPQQRVDDLLGFLRDQRHVPHGRYPCHVINGRRSPW